MSVLHRIAFALVFIGAALAVPAAIAQARNPLLPAAERQWWYWSRVRKAKAGEQDLAQHATTYYSVIDRAGKMAWVSLKPVTGRQHQLRAHMDILGTPVLSDQKYGDVADLPMDGLERKLHLHARRLTLKDAKLGEIDVTAPLPPHMAKVWAMFGFDPNDKRDPFRI